MRNLRCYEYWHWMCTRLRLNSGWNAGNLRAKDIEWRLNQKCVMQAYMCPHAYFHISFTFSRQTRMKTFLQCLKICIDCVWIKSKRMSVNLFTVKWLRLTLKIIYLAVVLLQVLTFTEQKWDLFTLGSWLFDNFPLASIWLCVHYLSKFIVFVYFLSRQKLLLFCIFSN